MTSDRAPRAYRRYHASTPPQRLPRAPALVLGCLAVAAVFSCVANDGTGGAGGVGPGGTDGEVVRPGAS